MPRMSSRALRVTCTLAAVTLTHVSALLFTGNANAACVAESCLYINRFMPQHPNLYHTMFADLGVALREIYREAHGGERDAHPLLHIKEQEDARNLPLSNWAVVFNDGHGPEQEDAVYDGAGAVTRIYHNGKHVEGRQSACELRCSKKRFDTMPLPWNYAPNGRWSLHYEVAAKDPLAAEEAWTRLAWVRVIARATVDAVLGKRELPPASKRRGGCVLLFVHREGRRRAVNANKLLETVREHSACRVSVTKLVNLPMKQRLKLLQAADVLVGVHGSAFAYTMFLRPEAAVVEIAPYGWLDAGYRNIAKAVGVHYFVVQAEDAWRVANPHEFRHADHAFAPHDIAAAMRAVNLLVVNTARRFGAACPEDMTWNGSKGTRWLGRTPIGCRFLWGDKDAFVLRFVPPPASVAIPVELARAIGGSVENAWATNDRLRRGGGGGRARRRQRHIVPLNRIVSIADDVLGSSTTTTTTLLVANALVDADVDASEWSAFLASLSLAPSSWHVLVIVPPDAGEARLGSLLDKAGKSSMLCGPAKSRISAVELEGDVGAAFGRMSAADQMRTAPLVALAAARQLAALAAELPPDSQPSTVVIALDPADVLVQGSVHAALPDGEILNATYSFEDAMTLGVSAHRMRGVGKGVQRIYGRHRLLIGSGIAPPASQLYVSSPHLAVKFADALMFEVASRGISKLGGVASHTHVVLRYGAPSLLSSAGNLQIRPRSPHDPMGASLSSDDDLSVGTSVALSAAGARAPALVLGWRALRGTGDGSAHLKHLREKYETSSTADDEECASVRW